MKPKNTKVAMIGCGKLGQDCAEVMAQQYMVEGYDVEPRQPENFAMKRSIAEAVKDKDMCLLRRQRHMIQGTMVLHQQHIQNQKILTTQL